LGHVNKFGWAKSCWTEEVLANKKLYRDYQFPSRSRDWLKRCKTSSKSVKYCIHRLQTVFEKSMAFLRKKYDSSHVESVSERAAVACSIAEEFAQKIPVPWEQIEQSFLQKWADGCPSIDTDLQACIIDKNPQFNIIEGISALKMLADQHSLTKPVKMPEETSRLIEIDQYHLCVKQIRYDMQVHDVWQKKLANAHTARHHARNDWKIRRRSASNEQAKTLMNSFCRFCVAEGLKVEKLLAELMDFKRHMGNTYSISNTSDIASIALWNNAVTSLLLNGCWMGIFYSSQNPTVE
jgi:hypothetical protein